MPHNADFEPMAQFFEQIQHRVKQQQSEVAGGPIVPFVSPAEIREHLSSRYDFTHPVDLNAAATDVEEMLRKWQVQVTHPRYFGLFNPSVSVASVLADTLVAMYNPQLASWRTSPVANEIEKHTLAWLAAKLGLPNTSVATFTTGGAESNLSAVIVSLTRTFSEYAKGGLASVAAKPVLYLTTEAHDSFSKIAHMTGLGRDAIHKIATDARLQMDLNALVARVADDRRAGFRPFMVVGTAGTTGAGAIDPLSDLARYCRSQDLWFHVDAAWGGAAVLSPRLRTYLKGIEEADSITWDAHKWLSVPMAAGMLFCRYPQAVAEAFRVDTPYMPAQVAECGSDPYTTSVQWSRRFIGLKVFLALATNGEQGYVEMIDRQTSLANKLRTLLLMSNWQLMNDTPLPVVCFTREGLNVPNFLQRLYKRQIAWMSSVRLASGPLVVRACITSFHTSETDVEWVVGQMNEIADER